MNERDTLSPGRSAGERPPPAARGLHDEMRERPMGWSESYYRDMRSEAEKEFAKRAASLLEAIDGFRAAFAAYGGFAADLEPLRGAVEELERLLAAYRPPG